jgi:hypothetical protein
MERTWFTYNGDKLECIGTMSEKELRHYFLYMTDRTPRIFFEIFGKSISLQYVEGFLLTLRGK